MSTAPRWGLVTVYMDRYLYYDAPRVVPGGNNAILVGIEVRKTMFDLLMFVECFTLISLTCNILCKHLGTVSLPVYD